MDLGAGRASTKHQRTPRNVVIHGLRTLQQALQDLSVLGGHGYHVLPRSLIKDQLKREMYATAFSYEDSQRVAVQTDPEVAKAADAIQEAKSLLDKSKKLIVRRFARDDRP